MDEKDLELENQNADLSNEPVMDPEESVANDIPELEETDTWKFDAEAPTLGDSLIQNDEFEIVIPKSESYETAVRPTKTVAKQETAPVKDNGVKGDKVKFAIIAILVAVIVAACAGLGVRYYTVPNSNEQMNPGNVAMKVGKTPISLGMYNYYYTCVSQNYIQYAQYGYYDLDTTIDYSKQKTTNDNGETISWAQLFEDETKEQIQYIVTNYEAAVKAGVTLTNEQQQKITESIAGLKESAANADQSVDSFISETYGDYCGLATLEKMLEQCYIAETYYQQNSTTVRYSDDEIKDYFEKNIKDYQNVGFAYLQVAYTEDTMDETKKKCDDYSKKIKSVDDMKKLIPTACKEIIDAYVSQGYAENAETCAELLASNIETTIGANEESFLDDAMEWLFSSEVPVGSCKPFVDENTSVIYILYKTTQPKTDDQTVYSVRQILIMPEGASAATADSSKEYTDEEMAGAKKEAEKLLAKFEKTNKTEQDFAKLAEKYSDDTESTSKGSSGMYGGLYEGIEDGQMVKNFNDWSLDKSRKYGDTGIVESNYGYHIMYFVRQQPKCLYNSEKDLKEAKEKELTSSTKIKEHKSVMKKAKVAKPVSTSAEDVNELVAEDAE